MKAFDFNRFLMVGRWDLVTNAKFYSRAFMLMSGFVVLPIAYKYFILLISKFIFGNQVILDDSVGTFSKVNFLVITLSLPFMLCLTFRSLSTKQGRINELTLPATNLERFVWHVLVSSLGTLLAFFLSVLIGDVIQGVCAQLIMPGTEYRSLVLATCSGLLSLPKVFFQLDSYVLWVFLLGVVYMLIYISYYVLCSAWKYNHTLAFALLYQIAFGFAASMLMGAIVSKINDFRPIEDFILSHGNLILFLLLSLAIFVLIAMWWLTYYLYKRAQITSRRNP